MRQQPDARRTSRLSSGERGAGNALERGSAGAADKVNVPVDELQRALGLRVVENAGRGNCFPLAIADATDGRVPAGTVRPQARQYINANPENSCSYGAHPAGTSAYSLRQGVHSDNQARVIAVALHLDISIFDAPASLCQICRISTGGTYRTRNMMLAPKCSWVARLMSR